MLINDVPFYPISLPTVRVLDKIEFTPFVVKKIDEMKNRRQKNKPKVSM